MYLFYATELLAESSCVLLLDTSPFCLSMTKAKNLKVSDNQMNLPFGKEIRYFFRQLVMRKSYRRCQCLFSIKMNCGYHSKKYYQHLWGLSVAKMTKKITKMKCMKLRLSAFFFCVTIKSSISSRITCKI